MECKLNVNMVSVEGARLPEYANSSAVGMDCFVRKVEILREPSGSRWGKVKYYLGFKVELPKGIEGSMRPKSSIYKKETILTNAPGTIDPDYRGEVCAIFFFESESDLYNRGEACCQMVLNLYGRCNIFQVDELSETQRGEMGFGSTAGYLMSKGEVEKCADIIKNIEDHGYTVLVTVDSGDVHICGKDFNDTMIICKPIPSTFRYQVTNCPFLNSEQDYHLKNILVEVYKKLRKEDSHE